MESPPWHLFRKDVALQKISNSHLLRCFFNHSLIQTNLFQLEYLCSAFVGSRFITVDNWAVVAQRDSAVVLWSWSCELESRLGQEGRKAIAKQNNYKIFQASSRAAVSPKEGSCWNINSFINPIIKLGHCIVYFGAFRANMSDFTDFCLVGLLSCCCGH